jgi:hypothetical protein
MFHSYAQHRSRLTSECSHAPSHNIRSMTRRPVAETTAEQHSKHSRTTALRHTPNKSAIRSHSTPASPIGLRQAPPRTDNQGRPLIHLANDIRHHTVLERSSVQTPHTKRRRRSAIRFSKRLSNFHSPTRYRRCREHHSARRKTTSNYTSQPTPHQPMVLMDRTLLAISERQRCLRHSLPYDRTTWRRSNQEGAIKGVQRCCKIP